MMTLTDQVVLVTGGSRGIGFAIAKRFVESDAQVIISSRSEESLNAAAEKLSAGNKLVEAIPCDVSNPEAIQALINAVIEKYDRIDVLVNNAGITRDNLMLRMNEQDWDRVVDTNLKGVFFTTKFASRYMLKQKSGCIINISSVVGITGNPGQTNYAASKSGILGLTKATALELASRNIRVNAIAPGYITTEMTEKLTDKQKQELTALIPLKKLGTPEDVANLAVFLASDQASYITGQVLRVDGGMVMA